MARRSLEAAEAKGREIVASLTELVEAMEKDIPVSTRFTVHTVEAAPRRVPGKHVRRSRRAD